MDKMSNKSPLGFLQGFLIILGIAALALPFVWLFDYLTVSLRGRLDTSILSSYPKYSDGYLFLHFAVENIPYLFGTVALFALFGSYAIYQKLHD